MDSRSTAVKADRHGLVLPMFAGHSRGMPPFVTPRTTKRNKAVWRRVSPAFRWAQVEVGGAQLALGEYFSKNPSASFHDSHEQATVKFSI